MALDRVPATGALVELRLDGAAVGDFLVRPAAGAAAALRLDGCRSARGLHVLELDGLDGGQVFPGAVELR